MTQSIHDDVRKVNDLLQGSLAQCGFVATHHCDVAFRADDRLLTLTLTRPMLNINVSDTACSSPPTPQDVSTLGTTAARVSADLVPPRFVETILEARMSAKYPAEPSVWRIASPSVATSSSRRVFRPSVLQDMAKKFHEATTLNSTLPQDTSHPQFAWEEHNIVTQALRYVMWWSSLALDDLNTIGGQDVTAAWNSQELQHLRCAVAPRGAPSGNSEHHRSAADGSSPSQHSRSTTLPHHSSRSMSALVLPDGRVVLWNLPDDHPLAISATLRRRRYSCSNVVLTPGLRDAAGEHYVVPARRMNTVNEINAVPENGQGSTSISSFDHHHFAASLVKSHTPIVWGMSVNAYRALILRKGPGVVLHPRTPNGGPSVLLSSIVLLAPEIVISPTSSVEALLANCALVESLPNYQSCVPQQEGVGHTLKCISQLIQTWDGYLAACSMEGGTHSSGAAHPQHSAPLFTSQFLAPSLSMILYKMLVTKQCGDATPFWVGVVLVVVLLPLLVTGPSTLPAQHNNAQRRRLSHDVATAVVNNLGRNWFFAVDHVKFVYELLDDRIRMCQARMVADFLSASYNCRSALVQATPTRIYSLHAPINECSVCRQTLGHLRQRATDAEGLETRLSGEFVIQCVRCGHGGHLQHMLEWAASPLSRGLGCPAGCDCNCAY
ncbi:Hypothetical protein, putative [Bodo saltans]|uniref:Uncharacterized protein n=1 Tax=Bodo saltans TaxID=75058 RepID=A0A0S4IWJ3_BODSA|nr:Hypothetical protein, putative [Bodo saltans]|eukprot:CUG06010.1 Hypothetical protein, putative [Bodo saltans]